MKQKPLQIVSLFPAPEPETPPTLDEKRESIKKDLIQLLDILLYGDATRDQMIDAELTALSILDTVHQGDAEAMQTALEDHLDI